MSRVLVVGGSGFIGHYLVENLASKPQHLVSGTFNNRKVQQEGCTWHQADVTDAQRLEEVFRLVQPETVVVLAAMADVGQCEREPQRAAAVNAGGIQSIAGLCGQHQAKLVFLSTEYVFNGETGNYTEDEVPAPTTQYGQTKWEAEQAVSQYSGPWSIIRTSMVYGWHPRSDQANLVTRVIENLNHGRPAYGFTDQYRSPIYVKDLAEGIARVMAEAYSGVSHLAGPQWIGMDQFVLAIAEQFGLNAELVQQTPSTDQRPSRLGLDSTQSVSRLGFQPRDAVSGLKEMQISRKESP